MKRKNKIYNDEVLATIYFELKGNSTGNNRVRFSTAKTIDKEILKQAIDIYCKKVKISIVEDFTNK
jgi:hypothetical protein